MASDEIQPVNLGSIARGAAIELFESAIDKIAANIADTTTEALAKRKLTLTFVFEPDVERRAVEVLTTAAVALAPVAKHKSRAYLGKDASGKPYVFPVDPRQETLFDPPRPEEKLLQFGLGQK